MIGVERWRQTEAYHGPDDEEELIGGLGLELEGDGHLLHPQVPGTGLALHQVLHTCPDTHR